MSEVWEIMVLTPGLHGKFHDQMPAQARPPIRWQQSLGLNQAKVCENLKCQQHRSEILVAGGGEPVALVQHDLTTNVSIEDLNQLKQHLKARIGAGKKEQVVHKCRRHDDSAINEDITFLTVKLNTVPAVREADMHPVCMPFVCKEAEQDVDVAEELGRQVSRTLSGP